MPTFTYPAELLPVADEGEAVVSLELPWFRTNDTGAPNGPVLAHWRGETAVVKPMIDGRWTYVGTGETFCEAWDGPPPYWMPLPSPPLPDNAKG